MRTLLPLLFVPIHSLVDPPTANTVSRNAYVDPALSTDTEFVSLASREEFGDDTMSSLSGIWSLNQGINVNDKNGIKVDVKSGKIAKLDLNMQLFPGQSNALLWRVSSDSVVDNNDIINGNSAIRDNESSQNQSLETLAITTLSQYITNHANSFAIDPAELFYPNSVRTALHSHHANNNANQGSHLLQLNLPRFYSGIPVRDSRAFATVKNGNLIMFGLNRWGDIDDLDLEPKISLEEGRRLLAVWAGEDLVSEEDGRAKEMERNRERKVRGEKEEEELEMEILDLCTPELQILVLDKNAIVGDPSQEDETTFRRYLKNDKHKHREKKNKKLPKNTAPIFQIGSGYSHALAWRICPKFTNQRQEIMEGLIDAHTGHIYSFIDTIDYFSGTAGVYPVSNDGQYPDGVLQSGYPVPFLSIRGVEGGDVVTSDTGGNYWSVGEKTVSLSGQYVHMEDQCGVSSLTVEGDFDWGGVNGTDCDTPGFGGEGNTQASRSGYYELNRIIEIARSHLPGNGWLKKRLVANMNIPESCNAFWNGYTVNFYRSSAQCSNTGEIAGVFDHEWAHGMDNNDLAPTIVKPSGEGIADIYTALRLGDSCIGRGFFNNPCSQFGDPCTNDCTGVRDIDYEQHLSQAPHTLTWTNANCGSADNVHCRGLVYSEAIWSLWKRDLPAFYGYDDNTALEIVMRLTFIAAGNVATWYSGSPPYGGCGGDSGYLSYLIADDDDGDINNGTPHMQAIYAAHHRQEIACDEPAVQDSGCAGSPIDAPELTVIPGSTKNTISWTSVPNASFYQVFRTEGVYKCSQGKVLLATVPSSVTDFTDTGLQNGREYYYIVVPKGADDSCFGPASECVEVSPLDGPSFQFTCNSELVVLNKENIPTNATHQCTLFAISNFTGTISLSCDVSSMDEVNCTIPSSVTFLPGEIFQHLTVTLEATSSAPIGQETLILTATEGTTIRNDQISVVVVEPGRNLTASYDPVIRTPRCVVSSRECSSGDLLDGKGVDEVNAPNVLDDCSDGTWGEYHVHPSNDKIVVKSGRKDGTDSGGEITERSYATISATVWSTFATSCFADFYHTNNITDPTWEYIGSQVTSNVREPEVLEVDYEVPIGSLQAVRVHFRYLGSPGTCPAGSYRNYADVDDLVFAVKPSEFYIDCVDELIVLDKSDTPKNVTKNCTLFTAPTFVGTVSFTCDSTSMTGVNCTAPPDVNVQNGEAQTIVSFIIEAAPSIVKGEGDNIITYAEAYGSSKMSTFPVVVVSSGGSQMASYDGQLGAPRCFAEGSECSSGDLLYGRGVVGPEPNAPNSLDDCEDGNSGDYRVDEQLDALLVRSGRLRDDSSNNDISEGEWLTISAYVFAYNSNDRADFWHTSDAFNPSWDYIGSIYSQKTNATEIIEIEYKLPPGPNQAVRVRYDYEGDVSTCPATSYGDVDDLVFAVKYVPFYISCSTNMVVLNLEQAPLTSEQLCTLHSHSDFKGSVNVICDSTELNGVNCSADSPVDIELDVVETNFTVYINLTTAAIAGENGHIMVSAGEPQLNITKTSLIEVLIIEGGGAQSAEYDSDLGAPRCYAHGSSCSSEELLVGRGEVDPGELNAPNTLDDCADGNWGNFHAHPSNDKIVVQGKNANVEMAEYDAVTVSASVWSTMPDNLHADFYYTSTPEEPVWVYIDTKTTTLTGELEVLNVDYNLPSGANQAVRIRFRYQGAIGPCPIGNYRNYGDADDLVFAVKTALFSVECPEGIIRINKEITPMNIDVQCLLSVSSSYSGVIDLSCSSSALAGVTCSTPNSVLVSSGETAKNITVTLSADTSVVVGDQGSILVSASDASESKNSALNAVIVNSGGEQVAIYYSSYGAPICDLTGTSCSSGDLLYGRGPVTPEPNYPNTLDDCEDGDKGTHHSDESIDKIVVRYGRLEDDVSNKTMKVGEYITATATVWAYSILDSADFFISSDISNPSWVYIGSVNATVEKSVDELSVETIVPEGLLHAVRVNFHYRTDEDITSCLGGSWDDVDDLAFTVEPAEPSAPSQMPSLSPSSSTTASPVAGNTNSPSPSISPTKIPAVVISVSSSIDWNVACNDIDNDETLVEISQVFEQSIKEVLQPDLNSNQLLQHVSTTEICGTAVSEQRVLSIRQLQDASSVYFTMEVEEKCESCDSNISVAESLFVQVNGNLNTAVNSGELSAALQQNGADISLVANATVVANSTSSNYTIVTNSPTAAPITASPATPKPSTSPSSSPTKVDDTEQPSTNPSVSPSANPTPMPSTSPLSGPTKQPSSMPSTSPSTSPSGGPSVAPVVTTQPPSIRPSASPTSSPVKPETSAPTAATTQQPTDSVGWFMKFSEMKCYQDCEGEYPCGGPKEFWNDSYSTLNECCVKNLGTSDQSLTSNCLAGGA